ncbi:MAG TPA: MarR family winged helix-turn-helix transcriptional regulator [Rhizomicrobium sp.]|jgi:DNA-binding MarR family transcriptional regulator|nr:MarR family winged helix-turn-helix transcriptional regulator [Rhizomicrobium sp.]
MNDLATAALACVRSGCEDLTIRQIAMLGLLCDEAGPHSTGSIALRLGVDKPVITRSINRFEQMGLIHQAISPKDRRRNILTPMPVGRTAREALKVGRVRRHG